MYFFPLDASEIASSCFVYRSLNMICLSVLFLFCFGIYPALCCQNLESLFCSLVSLLLIMETSHFIFTKIFLMPCILSLFFWIQVIYVLECLILSHNSWIFCCTFFFNSKSLFVLCYIWIIFRLISEFIYSRQLCHVC